jgi:hypothetical protein
MSSILYIYQGSFLHTNLRAQARVESKEPAYM